MQRIQPINSCEEVRLTPPGSWNTLLIRFLNRNGRWVVLVSLVLAVVLWDLAVRIWNFPAFILPGPFQVAARLVRALLDGSLIAIPRTPGWIYCSSYGRSAVGDRSGVSPARFHLLDRLASHFLVESRPYDGGNCATSGDLVWFGYIFQNFNFALIVSFTRFGATGRRAARQSLLFARSDALAA